MLTGAVPVFTTEAFCEIFLPTTALPKLTLVGFTWMAACACELVPFAVTSPAQPLRIAAEALKITAVAAHTHPLTVIFTLVTFSGRGQLVSWGGGGVRENGCTVLPELCVKDKNSELSLLLILRTVLVQDPKPGVAA